MHNLSGRRFGMLVAIERVSLDATHTGWKCLCDCGETWSGPTNSLMSGNTESCGCRRGAPTHGHSRGRVSSSTYSTWKAMIGRCTQASNPAFAYYQKLGITVCERWRHGEGGKGGFDCFLEDVGERPSLEMTLDRFPDNDGGYHPGNVRWATRREQANNRRTNKMFEYQGRTLTFAELVRETGMDKELLRHRILRAGWTVEEAIAAPKQQGRRRAGERPRV